MSNFVFYGSDLNKLDKNYFFRVLETADLERNSRFNLSAFRNESLTESEKTEIFDCFFSPDIRMIFF